MDSKVALVITVAFVTVTAGCSLAPTGPAGAEDVSPSAGAEDVSPQQSSKTICDFESLYDETIDSVVTVRTGGGLGSGFVFETTADGSYVVTNAHVVGDASSVTIQFTGGETRDGSVRGADEYTDLAVVRVGDTPDYVTALSLVDARPEHGQAVAALGNPFGLEETITHGIVSGLNRSMPTQQGFSIPNTIQTDAPISSGNSGGPLVTCGGEVVGVNTAGIAARGAENIGFAVSWSLVERVIPELIETGDVEHAYLGVRATPVTDAVAAANDLAQPRGVMIVSVRSDVPAADDLQGSTGVETVSGQEVPVGGDVILSVDGTAVRTAEDLSSILLTRAQPGEQIQLTILRDGQRMTVTTTVTERPEPGTG